MSKTLESRVFVNMWATVQNEFLREFNYMANCANLSLLVSPMYDNVSFQWSGFNDTMQIYIEKSVEKILAMKQEGDSEKLKAIFDQVKEKMIADLGNFYFEQSYQQAFVMFDNSLLNRAYEQSELKEELQSFTFERFVELHEQWLQSGRQIWYVTGNF
mmetsp:Transcript_14167/g.24084  ORF Transcript_14167/g.24084 Transcript_14167/m.24084 type:complete len:158 (-) Transcript_14167:871-1344(-)